MVKMDARTMRAIDEAYLEQQVLGTAMENGWMSHHIRDSRRVLMGDAGFPDWVFAKSGRVIFAELKREEGKLSGAQEDWAAELSPSGDYYVWRPSDWAEGRIKSIFKGESV